MQCAERSVEGLWHGVEADAALFKKRRNELAFRLAQAELTKLRAQAASGEIELAYVDEAGFAQVHPNSNAIKLSRSLGRPKLSWRMNQKLVPAIFILTVAATHQPSSCYNIN